MSLTEFERQVLGKRDSPAPKIKRESSGLGTVKDLRSEDIRSLDDEYDFPETSGLKQLDKQARGTTENDRDTSDIKSHTHDGANSEPINFANLIGLIPRVTVVPTWKPVSVSEQIVIYISGGTKRLYIFEPVSKTWMYTALT